MRHGTRWRTRCFPVETKWSPDKCNTVGDSDNLGLLRVWLFTPCACLSIYQYTSIVGWPLDLRELMSRFSFQAECHGGCDRCLMNCLVQSRLRLPISPHPSSPFLHHFLIYSHISACFFFCWARAFSPLNWKTPEVRIVHLREDTSFVGICMLQGREWGAQKVFQWGSNCIFYLKF